MYCSNWLATDRWKAVEGHAHRMVDLSATWGAWRGVVSGCWTRIIQANCTELKRPRLHQYWLDLHGPIHQIKVDELNVFDVLGRGIRATLEDLYLPQNFTSTSVLDQFCMWNDGASVAQCLARKFGLMWSCFASGRNGFEIYVKFWFY